MKPQNGGFVQVCLTCKRERERVKRREIYHDDVEKAKADFRRDGKYGRSRQNSY